MPTEAISLTKDYDVEPPTRYFSYSSAFEILLYLAWHSRPAIYYAVNCVARYILYPKKIARVEIKYNWFIFKEYKG